jgi:hypothetical protein
MSSRLLIERILLVAVVAAYEILVVTNINITHVDASASLELAFGKLCAFKGYKLI